MNAKNHLTMNTAKHLTVHSDPLPYSAKPLTVFSETLYHIK